MPPYKETHQTGFLSIENEDVIKTISKKNCDVGVQIAKDGRIWLCVNGIAFIRFSPAKETK